MNILKRLAKGKNMIYYSLFIILSFLSFVEMITNKDNKYVLMSLFWFISILLFFLVALREGIGYDFYGYKYFYDLITNSGLNVIVTSVTYNIEPLFVVISKISPKFEVMIFLMAVIGVLFKILFINKHCDKKMICLLLYFTGVYLNFDMGVIRQGAAISVFLFSIQYIKERNLFKYLVVIFVACAFHVSSLFFLPLYFIGDRKIERRKILILISIAFTLMYSNVGSVLINQLSSSNIPIISEKLGYYSVSSSGDLLISIVKRIVFLVIFLEFQNRYKTSKFFDICLNGYLLSIIMGSVFSFLPILAGRGVMGLYFLQVYIFSYMVSKVTIGQRIVLYVIVIILSLNSMTAIIEYGNFSGQTYYPYSSIFK